MGSDLDGEVRCLRLHRHAERRLVAAQALGRLGSPRAVPVLAQALSDSNPRVRRAAATSLAQIGSAEALAALQDAVWDASQYVRRINAVWGLRQFGGIEAGATLCGALSDPHAKVRSAAAEALGQLGYPSAAEALCNALQDPEQQVRVSVLRALLAIGNTTSGDALCASLTDSDWEVRALAVEALGSMRCAEALPLLRERLREHEAVPDVRNMMRQCINNLEIGTPEQVALPAVTEGGQSKTRSKAQPRPHRSRATKSRSDTQLTLW